MAEGRLGDLPSVLLSTPSEVFTAAMYVECCVVSFWHTLMEACEDVSGQ